MIQKYSTLQYLAETETEKKQLPKMLELFQNKAKKIPDQVFDPDVVTVDIQRWQYAKRQNKDVKPIEQYKDHVELHEAMQSYLSEEELELHNQKTKEKNITEGSQVLFSEGKYKVYEVSTPHALSELSKPSRWCVQNVSTAKKYLDDRGAFQIVHKDNKPLYAITQEEVWYFTDYELRDGKNYSGNQSTPYVLKEDFVYLNNVLSLLEKQPVSVRSRRRQDLVIVNNIAEIQQRVDKALLEGNIEELHRAFLNVRDFPITLPENLTLQGDLVLQGTNIQQLPKNLTVLGNVNVTSTKLQKIPDGLQVKESFLGHNTHINSIGSNVKIQGNLELNTAKVSTIPDDIYVGGGFNLKSNNIKRLPDSITKKAITFLLLSNNPLEELPDNLHIKETLSIQNTPLTKLPRNLTVGKFCLLNTKISELPEDFKIANPALLRGRNFSKEMSYKEEYLLKNG